MSRAYWVGYATTHDLLTHHFIPKTMGKPFVVILMSYRFWAEAFLGNEMNRALGHLCVHIG